MARVSSHDRSASMNGNEFGVAKWSMRGKIDRELFEKAAHNFSAGAAKSFSPMATKTGAEICVNIAGVSCDCGARRRIAASANGSLSGR